MSWLSTMPLPDTTKLPSTTARRDQRWYTTATIATGATAALIAAAVLLGWALNLPALRNMGLAALPMKANAGLCILILGAGVIMLTRDQPVARWVCRAGAIFTFLVSTLTLAEYATGWNPGIDQWLVREPAGALGTTAPGRMALNAAVGIALLSIVLLLLTRRGWWSAAAAQLLAIVVLGIAVLALLGYLYGIHELYAPGPSNWIALPSAVALVLLAVGAILAEPGRGFMVEISSPAAGGGVARRLMPVIVGGLLLLGTVIEGGSEIGWYSQDFELPLLITISITALSAIVWWNSRQVNRVDDRRRAAEAALQSANADLERRVAERTTRLEQEITERRRSEEALQVSEARYRTVVESLHEGIVILDSAGMITAANASAARILGLPAAELSGRSMADPLFHTVDENGRVIAADLLPGEITLHTAEPQRDVVLGLSRTGSAPTWIMVNSNPLHDPDHLTAYGVVESFTDITERKRLAAQVQAQAIQAEAERARIALILDRLPVAVGIAEGRPGQPEFTWTLMNRAAMPLFDTPPPGAPGAAYQILTPEGLPCHPNDLPVQVTLATGWPVTDRELVFRTSGGEERTYLANTAVLHDDPGVREVIVVFQDITERQRMEEARRAQATAE